MHKESFLILCTLHPGEELLPGRRNGGLGNGYWVGSEPPGHLWCCVEMERGEVQEERPASRDYGLASLWGDHRVPEARSKLHEEPETQVSWEDLIYLNFWINNEFMLEIFFSKLNRFILMNEGKGFVPGYPQSMLDILGRSNIAAVRGDMHKTMRSCMLGLVSPPMIRDQLLPKIDEFMRSYIDDWGGRVIDIQEKTKEVSPASYSR
ncbi:hypothetical protein B296_00032143 [Ensete ventricosum]|uniref:Uncharacterized protein n=1 Tax=Ensete ventricosum TaxID=4639 RepID=A0A426YKF3_ENSVE|nr:hypothetical protein B296_00032143 [Ensete ventricosum]